MWNFLVIPELCAVTLAGVKLQLQVDDYQTTCQQICFDGYVCLRHFIKIKIPDVTLSRCMTARSNTCLPQANTL